MISAGQRSRASTDSPLFIPLTYSSAPFLNFSETSADGTLAPSTMPSYSSPSPPITTRPIDDPRPTPTAQAPLSSAPAARKTSPAPVPTKPTPVAKVDSGPPPVGNEQVANNHPDGGINREVFDQILELDEDEDDPSDPFPFSKGMAYDYLSQAEKTFTEMATALKEKDLERLSSLGHFLKGSSAALGVSRVQSSCEQIQNYGQLREDNKVIKEDDAIAKISTILARARGEYQIAKDWLEKFFDHPQDQGEEESGEESD